MTRTTVSVDGENLRARVDHAKTLLERGDRVALLAYLTGASEDDVRRVGGFPAIPVGVDDQVAAVRAALDYGGDYMPDSRVHFDGFAALESLADLAREVASLREALRAFWAVWDDYNHITGECGGACTVERRVVCSDFAAAVEIFLPRAASSSVPEAGE